MSAPQPLEAADREVRRTSVATSHARFALENVEECALRLAGALQKCGQRVYAVGIFALRAEIFKNDLDLMSVLKVLHRIASNSLASLPVVADEVRMLVTAIEIYCEVRTRDHFDDPWASVDERDE